MAHAASTRPRVHGMLSALVAAGIEAGYLVSARLAVAHWQPGTGASSPWTARWPISPGTSL
jgi:hypothetical protein